MPDESLPTPAEFLRRELEKRSMTQSDLAFVLGVPQQAVNQLALGKRGINAALAKDLGTVFGVSPEYLLKLQKAAEVATELSLAREASPDVARKAKLVSNYPLREMVKRGWLRSDRAELEEQVKVFFELADVNDKPTLDHSAKRTEYDEDLSPVQLAWLFRVRKIARRQIAPKYSERALRDAMPTFRSFLADPRQVSRIPRVLSECGVRFVLVETLPGGKIDGVCFWLDATSPVVALSLRFDRIDNFWFVLRHELEHVLRRHGGGRILIDADLQIDNAEITADVPEEEREANSAASDFCVPAAKMDSFFARKSPFFAENDLLGFAKLLQVHPGLVAGQLRNRTKRYDQFTKFLVKIRSEIVTTAVVDGWGETYPI